jgi:hypothetical protein
VYEVVRKTVETFRENESVERPNKRRAEVVDNASVITGQIKKQVKNTELFLSFLDSTFKNFLENVLHLLKSTQETRQ